jgi:O-antigen/teichoic acid export membrane protein
MPKPSTSLIDKDSRIRNSTSWNLIGQIAPLLAALFAIPPLINGLGVERFGILSLAWMILGYFGLLDLGLGRALIVLVSEKLGLNEDHDIPSLISTALWLMLLIGSLGGLVLWVSSAYLVTSALTVGSLFRPEAISVMKILAISVPIVILTSGIRGILESYERFDLVNIVRIPISVLTFVSPLMVLAFANRLDWIVLVLLIMRLIFLVIYTVLVHQVNSNIFRRMPFESRYVKRMLSFGGWMTISNIISPLMMYLDRFVIGSMLGMAAVTYYVTPYEIVTKISVIPFAITGVLFPAFSSGFLNDRNQVIQLFWTGLRWIFIALFPIALIISICAADILRIWLGNDFANNSTDILQWLTLGILINSLAYVPFTFVQGAGRPDITAKLHFIELPFYLLLLWLGLTHLGLLGVAFAWVARMLLDMMALFFISGRIDKKLKWSATQILAFVFSLGLLMGGFYLPLPSLRLSYTALIIIGFAWLTWHHLLIADERKLILYKISRVKLLFK